MAAVATAPGLPKSRLNLDSESLSTIRDPRNQSDEFPSPGSAASSPHPDLNMEVATLSNKLISAINHQTHLDDALAATRQELETTQEHVQKLQIANQDHNALLISGELVRRSETEAQVNALTTKLADERKRRTAIEREKKGIEQELENLTTALFEEANGMVAAARKEKETSDRRNDQLKSQLKDTESLLANHQEQLAELKEVMSQMNRPRDDLETTASNSTAPSTPALPSHLEIDKAIEALSIKCLDDVFPAPPTSFTQLLSPVLRTDLANYEDFKSLLEIQRKSAPSSRVNSGSYGGVNIPGLATTTNSPSNASTHSLSLGPSHNSSAHPIIYNSSSPPYIPPSMYIPLKETKFYKRALAEDIEPTLRLDTAPGLSWLTRRNVISSICEGSLVVEPMPISTKMFVFPCSLCGEHRKGEEFTRTHRFRINESESAQRYPLCGYCLNRIRATCDYLSFLRMVKDGHWRTNGQEAEKSAWEESVRLRERMFWARIGGGVVPVFAQRDSPRISSDDSKPTTPFSAPPVVHRHGQALSALSHKENNSSNQTGERTPSESIGRNKSKISGHKLKVSNDSTNSQEQSSNHTPSDTPDADLRSSVNSTTLRESLAPKPRSRAASYESQRTGTPEPPHTPQSIMQRSAEPSPSRKSQRNSAPSPIRNASSTDQGLQINIPGGFEF